VVAESTPAPEWAAEPPWQRWDAGQEGRGRSMPAPHYCLTKVPVRNGLQDALARGIGPTKVFSSLVLRPSSDRKKPRSGADQTAARDVGSPQLLMMILSTLVPSLVEGK
jgi:hypothetical protein